MRISEGAVKSQLSRGRQSLSHALGFTAEPTTAGEVAS